MPSRKRIRIGNVPEHFSSPLHIGLQRGIFEKHLVDVELVTCPGGTGQMMTMLSNDNLDVAIALTEGLTAKLAKGCTDFKIVGTYTSSPLTWAISAGSNSPVNSVEDLKDGTIGISRFGSGSHIMSIVLAKEQGWLEECTHLVDHEPFRFAELSDFKGLRNGVNSGAAQAFMWETFTTKPYHDSGEVKRIGQIVTPWPAFLIAARSALLETESDTANRLLLAISEACALFIREAADGKSQQYIVDTYHQQLEDVHAWLRTVSYPADCRVVSQSILADCIDLLVQSHVLKHPVDPSTIVDMKVGILS